METKNPSKYNETVTKPRIKDKETTDKSNCKCHMQRMRLKKIRGLNPQRKNSEIIRSSIKKIAFPQVDGTYKTMEKEENEERTQQGSETIENK